MVIVKLTILFIVITLIVRFLIDTYLRSNTDVAFRIANGLNTWYIVLFGILIVIDLVGILYCTIWILFLR